MKEEWLFHGAVVPIDVETTAALVAEIKRLIDVIGGMALAQSKQEPVGKLQEPTAERSWFTIAELNAWADKKLAENPHCVMPKDEPERDEPPPVQRTWVGLTPTQVKLLWEGVQEEAVKSGDSLNWVFYTHINEALKEKNT